MPTETIDRLAAELDFEASRVRVEVDDFFQRLLPHASDGRERLFEAMRYSAIGGGKRLRPLLTVSACGMFAIDRERAVRVGSAIEATHVYSLIHDDLPCMDDDDLRRGKMTVHKAFGEAEAVLAGIVCRRLHSRCLPTRQRTRIRSCGLSLFRSLPKRQDQLAWLVGRCWTWRQRGSS